MYQSEARYQFNRKAIVNGGRVSIFNISHGGLLMELSPHLKTGDKVDIYCQIQGQELKISGVIVHTDPRQGHGVKLVHTLETQAQVDGLLADLHLQGKQVRKGAFWTSRFVAFGKIGL